MQRNKVVLVILDGWGIGPDYEGNAIKLAKTPTLDSLYHAFPHTELLASGQSVGLPAGEDGNTETGHLNIGAGRIVYQDLPRINMSISDGSFFANKAFMKGLDNAKTGHNIHLLGLIGQGGVHSVNEHLFALIRLFKDNKAPNVYLHLITDGRDSAPRSAGTYLSQVQNEINSLKFGTIATVMGRFYAMDRDHRWERTKVAYDAIVSGEGEKCQNLAECLDKKYSADETDEFLRPILPLYNGDTAPRIKSGDTVIFYNYRIDRPRQLTKALVLDDKTLAIHTNSFDPYAIKYHKSHLVPELTGEKIFARPNRPENLVFVTMTEYEKHLPVEIAFPPEFVEMPLSRVVALNGKRQLKLAESEKERFVTYYFNGQRDLKFPGEDVNITPSPKVPTYDLKPEMSGGEQTEKLLRAINSGLYELIVINYANPDMVAHTGSLPASIKACEYVDSWIKRIYQTVINRGDVTLLITADHGNAEELISLESGGIDTEHSSFPVPLYVIGKQFQNKSRRLPRGILGDIAPTILKLMGLNKPASMNGKSLL